MLLILFGHAAKSLVAQEAHPATSPVARDSEVVRVLNYLDYPHTGNGGLAFCSSSSLSLTVGFYIQYETMDVARPAPQGAHYHADVICLLP